MKIGDYLAISLLFIIGILSRIPFIEKMQSHWDGAQYTIGVIRYSLVQNTPSPPGYPIYIALGKFANIFTQDPHLAILSVSVFLSAFSAVLFYFVGKTFFNRTVGFIASLIFLSSPVFYYFGITANPYGGLVATTLLLVLTVYGIYCKNKNWGIGLSLVFSLAIGYRPQDTIFLTPLCILGLYGLSNKDRIYSVVAFIVASAFWAIPLFINAGGVGSYVDIMKNYTSQGAVTYPSFAKTLDYAFIVIKGIYLTLGVSVVILVFYLTLNSNRFKFTKLSILLLVWMLPSLLFNLIVRSDHAAHQVTFLSALILISSLTLTKVFEAKRSILFLSVLLICFFNLYTFFRNRDPVNTNPYVSQSYHYFEIRKNDLRLNELVSFIIINYSSEKTIVIVDPELFRQTTYYLKDFNVFSYGALDSSSLPHINVVHHGKSWNYDRNIDSSHVLDIPNGIENVVLLFNNRFLSIEAKQKSELLVKGNAKIYEINVVKGDKFLLSKGKLKQIND